jgi:hypothetical protein
LLANQSVDLPDEAFHVRIEIDLGIDDCRLPVNQVLKIFRKRFFGGHRRAIYQDGNHWNVLFEGCLDFYADPIITVGKPRFTGSIIAHPTGTNDS